MSSHPTQLTFGARAGLIVIVESALLSFIAVSALLLYVFFNWVRNTIRPPVQPWRFLRSPVDWYFASLLFSDMIQAMGSILNIKWINTGILESGDYCTAQGVLKQVGDVGVALATLLITCHTFAVLFFRWSAPDTKWIPLGFIGLVWVFLVMTTSIPARVHQDPPFYGPTTYWCWIQPKYRAEQIGLEYGIFWFTALVNFALYIPLFFCLRGNLLVEYEYPNGKRKMRLSWRSIKADDAWARASEQRKEQMDAARRMIAYPVAYVFIIAPISVTRWIQFTQGTIAPGAASFGGAVFASSGFVNTSLYLLTRPGVLRAIFGSRSRRGSDAEQGGRDGPYGAEKGGMTMQGVTVLSTTSSLARADASY